jgi:hypothetical protein
MKPAIFLQAAQNINDFVTSFFNGGTGSEGYICHALNVELKLSRNAYLPEDYNEIVKLFEPTEEEYSSFDNYLAYGYFGMPSVTNQAERILACLFMYQIAKDMARNKPNKV